MELTRVRGIGAAYAERLMSAGVRDVADLAWHEDLSTLSEKTGIAASKLASFRVDAIKLAEREHRAPMDVVHSVASAVLDLAEETRELALLQAARGLRWVKEKMPATRRSAGGRSSTSGVG